MGQKCSQCDTPAYWESNGHPLCVNCAHKAEQIHHAEMARTAAALNLVMGLAEAQMPFLGPQPRAQIPHFPEGSRNVSTNHVTVNGTVGVINTGMAKSIRSAVTVFTARGEVKASEQFEALCKGIAETPALTPDQRQEALEYVGLVVEQSHLPEDERKQSVLKQAISRATAILVPVASLAQLWSTFLQTLQLHQ